MAIPLQATTARAARTEIRSRFPAGAKYRGYNATGECVLMSLVRAVGDNAYVATVRKNNSSPAVSFDCEPLS